MSSARSSLLGVVDAVCATVAYADLFDFPMVEREIWRDLIGIPASSNDTREAIAAALAMGSLTADAGYLTLPDRTGLAALRRRRAKQSARLWPIAYRFGSFLAAFPFVRM